MSSADWLQATADRRVGLVWLARLINTYSANRVDWLQDEAARLGITATEGQAQALLDAVAAWDEHDARHDGTCPDWPRFRARLDAAVAAIVGEQP